MNERIKDAFDSVKADEILKENTYNFITEKSKKKSFPLMKKQLIAVAACVVFTVVMLGGYFTYFTQVSAISVDINPSIELGINRFDRVVSAKSFNAEGNEILESVNLSFKDYSEALQELMECEETKKYLTDDSAVTFTITGKDESRCDKIIENVENCKLNDEVHCYKTSDEFVEKAHHLGMSFGKYKAFLLLKELDPTVTEKDVENLTMKQIRERINELSTCEETTCHNTESDNTVSDCHGEGNTSHSKHSHNKK